MEYKINNPDYSLSPFTGMTREHWIGSARFLIDGVMKHIDDMNDPIRLPKQHQISYPAPDDPPWKFKAAEYEGLARTFMAAAPVIEEYPGWTSRGKNVRDYYANQILSATDPASPNYLWKISELKKEYGNHQHYQHTVEGAALVIGLMASREQIWESYSSDEKNQVAGFITDYAHNRTLSHNWRYFNLMMLSFLRLNGYPVDETAIRDHLQHLMAYYTGDGWYRDHLDFDFYNPWAFQFYGPLWCSWYGYEFEPVIAGIIEKRHNEFMKTYPRFFSRKGHQCMWGRSIIYRAAASAALGSAFLLKSTDADPGWTRRIASGNLMQFLGRPDVFHRDIPNLGYYRSFEPLVQNYSCAASPFWIAKIYAALSVPSDSPFWTAKENENHWGSGETRSVILMGPGLHITNFDGEGTSEIRPGKVQNALPYYNRISFNTDFPLEVDSAEGATAMTYSLKEHGSDKPFTVPLKLLLIGEENGVLYRQFNMGVGDDYFGPTRIDLAEVMLPRGVLRIDRLRIGPKHELHLGHYGLPHLEGIVPKIHTIHDAGEYSALIAEAGDRTLAMTIISGWDELDHMEHNGLHPESDTSTVIFARRQRDRDYSGMELLVSVMLHASGESDFTGDELNPVRKLSLMGWTSSRHPCGANIVLKDGREFNIDFGNIEGRLKV